MTSRAERKRRKRSNISLAGGEVAKARPPQGYRRDLQPAEDARETALQARKRHSGITNSADALQPLCGTEMGLCIRALGDPETNDLRDLREAWQAISASRRNYRLLYIGQTGEPKGAAIAMVPDQLQTDPSLSVDIRTADERVSAAKASWAAWEACINLLPMPQLKWAIRGALDGFLGEACLWRDRAPTVQGQNAVTALRMIVERRRG